MAPSNRNVDVRIFSPGDSGAVTQTNAAGAAAIAGNANETDQSATQSGSGTQAVGQEADNDQYAGAEANGVQVKPSNDNVVVRIDSPGEDGPVTQSNVAGALALAGNANETEQSAEQSGGGAQAVSQKAGNDQDAKAKADAVQVKPSNSNVSVRIGSPGNGGSVTQTNAALSGALAGNANETKQSADQSGGGSCKCGGDGVQAVEQKAKSDQSADAESNAKQIHPSNSNTSVRIHSPGDDGPVKQTNLALSGALAGNANETKQSVEQDQGGSCKCGGDGVQAVDQHAYNDQDADAKSNAIQVKPSNDNTAVAIGGDKKCGCHDDGKGGDVTQTNAAFAGALAGNVNETKQSVEQYQDGSCKCGGGVQAVGQKAYNEQDADAESNAIQVKPSNDNTAVGGVTRSGGCHDDPDGSDVAQTNIAGALGIAVNANETDQSVGQSQAAVQVEASAQRPRTASRTRTPSRTRSSSTPSNDNTAVGGSGGGDVTQTNAALERRAGRQRERDDAVGRVSPAAASRPSARRPATSRTRTRSRTRSSSSRPTATRP